MIGLDELKQSVMDGDGERSRDLVLDALNAGSPPQDLLNCMVAAMDEIGRRFQNGDAFIPDMLFAARAMRGGVESLEPTLVKQGITRDVTAVIGTVKGDLHDLGKDLVIMMWKGANFEVIDLGIDVPTARFLSAIEMHKPQLVGLSALLTTTMPAMEATVKAIKAAEVGGVKTIVGGAPVSQDFADAIGADAYGHDAVAAVDIARRLVA